ncbi:hypothetical protein STAS_29242 [Striga asiatica]|uniref:DUF1664 domain-containing protein n=1 Tax=Striga asiatica TaxID=4170 RepID=A0A5A7R2B9_STRAF|nr:hypothetical protein STAS_29242 [Striga asiatica]
MAMQTGVAASKVLVLVGAAGVTGSIILRSGSISDLLSHLQVLIKTLNEAEASPGKYDAALLAAQVRQLAKEIKELSLSNPVTVFNGNSSSSGMYCLLNLAYHVFQSHKCASMECGWSFSDMMFVTKNNMANAVATVSKQLENVSEALASTKKHLTKRLENLDWKLDEQREISKLISSDVTGVRSNLNQIGYDINLIHETLSGLEGKIELLESKQDMTNSGLWYLCQVAGNIQDGPNSKVIQDVGVKLIDRKTVIPEREKVKGLQFIVGNDELSAKQKTTSTKDGKGVDSISAEKVTAAKMRIHRSYPVGLSFAQNIVG